MSRACEFMYFLSRCFGPSRSARSTQYHVYFVFPVPEVARHQCGFCLNMLSGTIRPLRHALIPFDSRR
jgi:hypothetical protein